MRLHQKRTSVMGQRGFSMVEMLMTAFILAVGIMGLTLLQVMSLKGGRGAKSLTTGVQVGEMIMDQIEMEGRLSWLNITASQYTAPAALTGLHYIGKGNQTGLPFTIKGQVPVANAPDPVDAATYYQVAVSEANVSAAGSGKMGDFTVDVLFSDQVNQTTGVAIPRHVVITRRILHG
ncbi:MAG TPA: prepilin-type N-terminal cleavage/methylation domain-containing protein [Geothrix sp.]|nr:prepilin-type N-terminal cleavage/methylation domain-containing protein [Geothrix sp.]